MLTFLAAALATPPDQTVLEFPEDVPLNDLTVFDLEDCVVFGHQVTETRDYVHGGPITRATAGGWTAAGFYRGALRDVRVLDTQTAFVLWEWQIEGVYPGLLVTRDGGASWEEIPLADAARRTGECCFQFTDGLRADANGVAVRLSNYGWIASHDGGETWVDGKAGVKNRARRGRSRTCRVEREPDTLLLQRRTSAGWITEASMARRAPTRHP